MTNLDCGVGKISTFQWITACEVPLSVWCIHPKLELPIASFMTNFVYGYITRCLICCEKKRLIGNATPKCMYICMPILV